jgi:hypothetical protein
MMFLKIPLTQLQRRVPDDLKKEERNAITSGYVTLLYYSLRPTASYEQLDRYWREFVASFWTQLLRTPGRSGHTVAACRIVSALFNGSRKPWNEQRALDQRPQCMVLRGELPLLDPKWVRRSLSLVLQFVELLLEATPWSENERQEDEPVKTMWLTLLDSLVEASSKEVMASTETKDAMAHIVNLLRRLWDSHTAQLALSQQNEDTWANKFCFLVETVVQKLGASHFADKFLTRNESDEFEVASTPSRSRQHSTQISPLLYFVDLLVNQSEGKLPDEVDSGAMFQCSEYTARPTGIFARLLISDQYQQRIHCDFELLGACRHFLTVCFAKAKSRHKRTSLPALRQRVQCRGGIDRVRRSVLPVPTQGSRCTVTLHRYRPERGRGVGCRSRRHRKGVGTCSQGCRMRTANIVLAVRHRVTAGYAQANKSTKPGTSSTGSLAFISSCWTARRLRSL